MRIGIVGSRHFNDYEKFVGILSAFGFDNDNNIIISGGAKGADTLAKYFAEDCNLQYVEYKPKVNDNSKKWEFVKAAHARNELIVTNSDVIIAFWDGDSRGTEDTIKKAREYKKPTFIFYI